MNRIDSRFEDFSETFLESLEQRAWEEKADDSDDMCGSVDQHFDDYFPCLLYFCNEKGERTSYKDATDYYWETDDGENTYPDALEPCDFCKKHKEQNCSQDWQNPKTTNCYGKIYSIWH